MSLMKKIGAHVSERASMQCTAYTPNKRNSNRRTFRDVRSEHARF
jgi:hypothetical protein